MTEPSAPTPPWDDGLLPGQRTAAAHSQGHARLLAGPGTGKTYTLMKHVLFLVMEQKVDPPEILALTFTRAAVHELRSRVNTVLEGRFATRPTVMTLHSFALRNLLRNSHLVTALPQPLRIADDWEERHIIVEDLKRLTDAEDVYAVQDRLDELSADWDTLMVEGDPAQRRADPIFLSAWQQHRQVYGYTLRDELVYQLKRALLERADLDLQPKAKHLIVDEYQDLNACDLAVIDAIRQRGAALYGAGDDDQSIYGFRYALPIGIRQFTSTYTPAADLKLDICIRCDKAIIELAKFVAKLDPEREDKPLLPRDGAGAGEVRLLRCGNQYDEANVVAGIARYLLDAKTHRPDDILILLRQDKNGAFSKVVVNAFAAAAVPLAVDTSEGTPLDTQTGRGVLALMRSVHHTEDSLAWRTLLSERVNGIGNGAFSALYIIARDRPATFGNVIVQDDLSTIPRFGTRLQTARTKLLADIALMSPFLAPPPEGTPPRPLADCVTDAVTAVIPGHAELPAILDYLRKVIEESDAASLAELLQIVSSSKSETERQPLQPGAVNLLTMHRAKGLSAKTVILMAAEDEYIPGKSLGVQEGDARRLLYVSLTRAKERLIVTFVNQRTGQQERMGRATGRNRTLTRYLRVAPLTPEDGNQYVINLTKP